MAENISPSVFLRKKFIFAARKKKKSDILPAAMESALVERQEQLLKRSIDSV